MMQACQQAMPLSAAPTEIVLRDYQQKSVDCCLADWRSGLQKLLLILPTGAGKTIVFAELARLAGTKGKRTLILAHREELLMQAIDKIHMVWPDARVGLIRGSSHQEGQDITVASVQSLHAARLPRLSRDYRLVVTDEAHHSPARSYQRVYEYLSEALLLGVTATPKRADGKGLKTFDKVSYKLGIPDLIKAGYLASIESRQVKLDIDLDRVRLSKGDFNVRALGELFRDHEQHVPVVAAWKQERKKHKVSRGLAFCADVQHAKDLAAAFQTAGVRADWVAGEMPPVSRTQVLAAYHRGEIEVLTNCNVLTEGFDEPAVDCLLMVRPTKSQAMYIQMVGRGLRMFPGKDSCRVIDFAGTTRHRLVQAGDCLKDDYNAAYAGTSWFKLHWTAVGQGFLMTVQDGDGMRHSFRLEHIGEELEDLYRATRTSGRQVQTIAEAPLTWCQGQAEEIIRRLIPKDKLWLHKKGAAWRKSPPSPKQISMLERMNIPIPATKGEASDLLNQHFYS